MTINKGRLKLKSFGLPSRSNFYLPLEKSLLSRGFLLILTFISVIFLFGNILSGKVFGDQKSLPITNIARGEDGALSLGYAGVITDNVMWKEFWSSLHSNKLPEPKLPHIWFNNNEIVVFCVSGRRPTSGYQMVVKNVVADHNGLVAHCYEHSPFPSQFVIQNITQPYHIVRILLTPSVKKILPGALPWRIEFYMQGHHLTQLGRHVLQGQPTEMVGKWKGHWVKISEFRSENSNDTEEGDDPRY